MNFLKADILSKSTNSAFLGMKMKGKPIGVINGNKITINEQQTSFLPFSS